MARALSVLLVEHDSADAERMLDALRDGGFEPRWRRVESEPDLRDALAADSWDLVLSEFALPQLEQLRSLSIVRRTRARIPFVLVTRAIDGAKAAHCVEADIDNLVDKDNLGRLAVAIERTIAMHAEHSERETLLRQLRQAQKMEAIGRLAGGVAHDFNNLLTVIQGYGQIIKRRLVPRGEFVEEIGELLGAAERAAGLTRQLLAFSRSQPLSPQIIDVGPHIIELRKILGRVIREDVELEVDIAPGTGHVRVDPRQFEQVLINLAVNARDAMPDGGRLTIATSVVELGPGDLAEAPGLRPGSYVRIGVSDEGVGMDPETLRHIFEPFFTTKEIGKGTGLGLATVFGIVQQSAGAIRVTSTPGSPSGPDGGTRFDVYIPRVEAETVQAETGAPEEPGQRGSGRILLVEDEAAVRGLLAGELRRVGYEVIVEANGLDAWQTMEGRGEPVDLVVTDVIMPAMRGPDLVRRLRERWPELRVLFVSGWQDPAKTKLPELDERTRFLQKPFDPATLIARVGELLNR